MSIELSEADAGAPLRLKLNEELVLRLAENPTTGYRWEFRHSGSGELGVVDDHFVGPGQGDPGAAGYRLVRLVARQPGEVQVQALMRRAWDAKETALDRRSYTITIG